MPAFGTVSCGPDGIMVQGHPALGRRVRRRVMTEVEKLGETRTPGVFPVKAQGIRVLGLGSRCRSLQTLNHVLARGTAGAVCSAEARHRHISRPSPSRRPRPMPPMHAPTRLDRILTR